jgi:hypothetical protein
MIYYNASITSTSTRDVGQIQNPPSVRFNETRDAPIIRNASQYYFSIIRFAMNGPNKNLPLFIPIIQTNLLNGDPQTDPNLTIYYVSVPYQREWAFTDTNGDVASRVFTITPASTAIIYIPETVDTVAAPIPSVPVTGIVKQDLNTRYYWVYTYKHWVDTVNKAMREALYQTFLAFRAQWNDPATFIDLTVCPFPYNAVDPADLTAAFNNFLLDHDVPKMVYNEVTRLFEIYGDTRAFNISGQLSGSAYPSDLTPGVQLPLPAFVIPALPAINDPAVAMSTPFLRLFFNSNLFGLFSNFNNTYWNANNSSSGLYWPLTAGVQSLGDPAATVAYDYTNEILFTNQQFTNILNNNPFLQNYQGVPPPTYNPLFFIPTENQNLYWIARQDYNSTNSLWSPISAIVFTSTLLPVKNEYTAKPLTIGAGNITTSTNTPNAFEPIITDFVVDQQQEKAEGWRDFVLYEPTAEYKLCSMTASHEEIRNIDIQVFWKYRLTGELYPVTMANCSDVTLKMMFRRADYRS